MVKTKRQLSRTKWNNLTSNQKDERKKALQVLSAMRKGKYLTNTAKELGITAYKVKKHLGRIIRKKGRKWVASKKDRIERSMTIYERGMRKTIVLASSADASLVGTYLNAVKKFLATGDVEVLKPFRKKQVKDSKGKKHTLETRPEKLFEIDERQENLEFYEIYESEDYG